MTDNTDNIEVLKTKAEAYDSIANIINKAFSNDENIERTVYYIIYFIGCCNTKVQTIEKENKYDTRK